MRGGKLIDFIVINEFSLVPEDSPNEMFIYVDIDSVGKGTGKIDYSNFIKGKDAPSRARRVAKSDSVIISTVRPYLKGFAYIKEEKENCIFSTGFAVLQGKDKLLSKYLYLLFMFSKDLMTQMEVAMPKSSYPSINKSDIENFTIPVPPLSEQKKIVQQVEKIEEKIKILETRLMDIPQQKEQVLKKYL